MRQINLLERPPAFDKAVYPCLCERGIIVIPISRVW